MNTNKISSVILARQNGVGVREKIANLNSESLFALHECSRANPGPFRFWWNESNDEFFNYSMRKSAVAKFSNSFGNRYFFDGRLCYVAGWTAIKGYKANWIAVRKQPSREDIIAGLYEMSPEKIDDELGEWKFHGRMSVEDAEKLGILGKASMSDKEVAFFDNSESVKQVGLNPNEWDFNGNWYISQESQVAK